MHLRVWWNQESGFEYTNGLFWGKKKVKTYSEFNGIVVSANAGCASVRTEIGTFEWILLSKITKSKWVKNPESK